MFAYSSCSLLPQLHVINLLKKRHVKKVVWTSISDPVAAHDSPTPEASCRATCDKLPVFNPTTIATTLSEHTLPPTPQIQSAPNPYADQSTSNHARTTYILSNKPHTTHIPHNGPSKGVPRDAARVRQGRPSVHHQVQQAYVFTLSMLVKPRKGKIKELLFAGRNIP